MDFIPNTRDINAPPEPSGSNYILRITLVDGDNEKTFDFSPIKYVESFDDIKPRLDQFIIQKGIADNWSLE